MSRRPRERAAGAPPAGRAPSGAPAGAGARGGGGRAGRWLRAAGRTAKRHAVALGLSLLAGLLYLPSLDNPFVYDDSINIVKNPSIRRLANTPRFFTRPETTTSNESFERVYRPLSTVSYAVDYAIGGLEPRGYILHNVLLHALATAACVAAARALTGSLWLAAAAGLAFALHPVQTEPVNWATGRATILFGLFTLLALRLYLAAARRPPPAAGARGAAERARAAGTWALSCLACAAALLSKETAAMIPAALVLVEWLLPPRPSDAWGRRLLRVAPFAALAASYLLLRARLLGSLAGREEYWGGSFWRTLQVMGQVMARYVRLLVLPVGQNLEHAIPIPERWWDPASLAGFALVAGAVLAAVWLRARRPVASFGALWIGVMLLPVSNLIPFYGLIAERHLYLALPGFGLIVGDLLARGVRLGPEEAGGPARPRRPIPAALALAALGLAWAGASLHRSRVWSDEVRLWEDTVAKSPSKVKAHTNLGLAYLRRNRLDEALSEFHEALQIFPRSAAAHASLGLVHLMRNEPERAVEELRQAIETNPRHLDAHKHLAGAYLRLGRFREAERVARQALEVRDEPDIRALLAGALFKGGRLEEAEAELARVLEQDPQHADALRQMGLVRHRQGRAPEAAEFYRRALAQAPAADLHFNIALTDLEGGDYAAAAEGMARARALAPHIPELAMRQAQAEIARDLRGRVPAEALRSLRTEDVRGHAAAAALLHRLPDAGGIAERLAPALALRGAPEARAGVLATMALLERSRGRVAQARARYEGLIEIEEGAAAHLAAGEMAVQGTDYAAAESHLGRALELDPRLAPAHARLGFLARLRGDPRAALARFQRALVLSPGLEPALDGRCEALYDLERWEEARGCFEARARKVPDHPEAHYFLSRVYRRLGNAERARAELARHEEIRGRRAGERGDTAASLE